MSIRLSDIFQLQQQQQQQPQDIYDARSIKRRVRVTAAMLA